MVTGQVESTPTVLRRARDDVDRRSIMPNEIEIDSGKGIHHVSEIAS